MGGRELSDTSRPLNVLGRGRRHAVERGAMLEGVNGVDEGEPGELVDILDDVTARPAPEAMEPVGDTANGQRGSRVVVERATAHEPAPALR